MDTKTIHKLISTEEGKKKRKPEAVLLECGVGWAKKLKLLEMIFFPEMTWASPHTVPSLLFSVLDLLNT